MICQYRIKPINKNNKLFNNKNYTYIDTIGLHWKLMLSNIDGVVFTDIYINNTYSPKRIVFIPHNGKDEKPYHISHDTRFIETYTGLTLSGWGFFFKRNKDILTKFYLQNKSILE